MIPGWLSESGITSGAPVDGLLPESYEGVYSEGSDGVLLGSTEMPFTQITAIYAKSYFAERFGYGASDRPARYDRMLEIRLVQEHVFGILLLDSFTPPNIAREFFEFPDWLVVGCNGPDATSPVFAMADGSSPTTNELIGTPTEATDDGPGHSPSFTTQEGRQSDGAGCQQLGPE